MQFVPPRPAPGDQGAGFFAQEGEHGGIVLERSSLSDLVSRAADSLEQASGLLNEAARRLRRYEEESGKDESQERGGTIVESASRRPADGSGDPRDISASHVAQSLVERWGRVTFAPVLTVGPVAVDLSTAHGKWQLLILAVLRGARVLESVVHETFAHLVEDGLDGLERLAAGEPGTRESLRRVFAAKYRALGRREAKVEALLENASLLMREYGGDLDRLYHRTGGESQSLIQELQRFKQIGLTAHWLCRVLKIHTVWPDVGAAATRYFDRYTDLPLERLGLVAPEESGRSARRAARFVDVYLEGETTPLYLHGLHLCSKSSVVVCAAGCPFSTWCPYVKKANEIIKCDKNVRE